MKKAANIFLVCAAFCTLVLLNNQSMSESTEKHEINHSGYHRCTFSVAQIKTYHFIHRIVAYAFLGSQPIGHEINHKDGIKGNNRADNLEWVTHSENQLHAVRTGLRKPPIGELNSQSKLTIDQVKEIKYLLSKGHGPTSISKRFNVTYGAIQGIKRGENWKHVC